MSTVDEAGPVPADRSMWFNGEWGEQHLPRNLEEFPPAVDAVGRMVEICAAGEVGSVSFSHGKRPDEG